MWKSFLIEIEYKMYTYSEINLKILKIQVVNLCMPITILKCKNISTLFKMLFPIHYLMSLLITHQLPSGFNLSLCP